MCLLSEKRKTKKKKEGEEDERKQRDVTRKLRIARKQYTLWKGEKCASEINNDHKIFKEQIKRSKLKRCHFIKEMRNVSICGKWGKMWGHVP